MKPRSFIIFTAVMLVGGIVISPAWAEDESAKPVMPATVPSEALGGEAGVSVPHKVRSSGDVNENDYRIGQNDLLDVKVFQSEIFNRTVRVSSSGYISMPLIGQVKAGGLTALELEQLIATKLQEKYLQEPQVSVFITEYTSQRVTIEGNVRNPGIYVLKGHTTLRQALAMSAGMDSLADLSEIRIHRMINGERKIATYDLGAIREGKLEDPEVRGNDIILVDSSGPRAFIRGAWDTLRDLVGFGVFR